VYAIGELPVTARDLKGDGWSAEERANHGSVKVVIGLKALRTNDKAASDYQFNGIDDFVDRNNVARYYEGSPMKDEYGANAVEPTLVAEQYQDGPSHKKYVVHDPATLHNYFTAMKDQDKRVDSVHYLLDNEILLRAGARSFTRVVDVNKDAINLYNAYGSRKFPHQFPPKD
jgi:gluconate kinase